MDYEYDIFLSYSRKTCVAEWVRECFLGLFKDYLTNELGEEPRIFVDTEDIQPGDIWPERMRKALATSRCLLAMLSPPYFTSAMCCQEFAVMHNRSRKLGRCSTANPSGLILPVRTWDGDSFPQCVRDFQSLNCREFVRHGPCFRQSSRFLDLQESLVAWVPHAARVVGDAPTWQPDWMSPEWLDVPIDDVLVRPALIKPPRMA
jgi:hypothetical protein